MNVGVSRITLRLAENQSLKGKRRVIGSLGARIRNKFNVSMAEVDNSESWQIATLGIAVVSNSARHADEVISDVVGFIEGNRGDVEIVSVEQENMSGF